MNKFKKDDEVIVTTGKDSGKTGKILKILPKKNTAIVEGINKKSKHKKPQQEKAGGIIESEFPIAISNLMHFDKKSKISSKIRFEKKDNKTVRKLKVNNGELS